MKADHVRSPLSKAVAITGTSLYLGLLFDLLFFGKLPGLSYPLYVILITAGLCMLGYYLGRPVKPRNLWLLAPLLFFSAMVAVRASPLLIFLNIMASLALLLLIGKLQFGDKLTHYDIPDYFNTLLLPLKFFRPLLETLSELIALPRLYRNQPRAMQIAKGILITIPVLIVFLLLFASADLIVNKYLSEIFNIHFNATTMSHLILIALATLIFTGAYSYVFGKKPAESKPKAGNAKFLGPVESNVLLGSVNVLFFLFILIQLTYLFGGQHNITALGFTYAQYARKGFFELIAVAVISFALLWIMDKKVSKSDHGHALSFRLLSLALVIQVILIMVSAFKRLYLYEQAYGFTTLRLYSHAFVIFLAVIFVILGIKIYKNLPDYAFAFPAFLATIAFLMAMNLINPDAFIARQNLNRFHHTGKIDAGYIASLSADALPELKSAQQATTGEDKYDLTMAIQDHASFKASHRQWQSWNLARNQ